MRGIYSLIKREIRRFTRILNQSIFPPIISSMLFLAIFHFVVGKRGVAVQGISYLEFLVPGLIMMSVVNNAFQNSAFSLFHSKFIGYFEHILSAPLSYLEIAFSYIIGSVSRTFLIMVGTFIVVAFFVKISFFHIGLILIYFLLTAFMFGSFGIIAGLWAEQFDHLGVFNTFLLTPLTMLGGVFYSISNLPQHFQIITKFDPIFYLVDGFRYAMLGIHDFSILYGLLIITLLTLISFSLAIYLLKKGWKVRE